MKSQKVAFVTSAYNESQNLAELYVRCKASFDSVKSHASNTLALEFCLVIADNCSCDDSIDVLNQLVRENKDLVALFNQDNYGPEPSSVNALRVVADSDLFVLLCSDLQDPPELSQRMLQLLLEDSSLDAVLAIKRGFGGDLVTRIGRKTYYKGLRLATRLSSVPTGYHGFGCYRKSVIDRALLRWDTTEANLRQCLVNSSHSLICIDYLQELRLRGASSYKGFGYWREALTAFFNADAFSSRLSVFLGLTGLLLAFVTFFVLVINPTLGAAKYVHGVPILMFFVLLTFSLQTLMVSLLSRQVERLRFGSVRKTVRYKPSSID